MRLPSIFSSILFLTLCGAAQGAPPVEVEIATERGLQITAPHEWLQLLTEMGIDNVRIRGARTGEQPKLTNVGTEDRPRYHALGILNAREELLLPGGTFRAGDRRGLADYFRRLSDEGPEGMTAPRGRFGLTEKQLAAVYADLAQPIEFETAGQPITAVIERLQTKFQVPVVVDPQADRALRAAKPIADDAKGLTAGTGLAILLRGEGLALRPEKPQGNPLAIRVVPVDSEGDTWPVGWEPEGPPVEIAPALFEFVNVEIDGYTLREALEAIGPRIKLPYYFDRAALARHHVDPDAIQIALPQSRTYYKRILDRVLAQARLGGQLRVDEAGTVFYWITR